MEAGSSDAAVTALALSDATARGDDAAGERFLSQFLESGSVDYQSGERLRTFRELMILSGMPVGNSWETAIGLENQVRSSLDSDISRTNRMFQRMLAEATDDDRYGIVSRVVAFGLKFADIGSAPGASGQLAAFQIESGALMSLPSDTPYGTDGLTTGERIRQIRGEISEMLAIHDYAQSFLQSATAEEMSVFYELYGTEGETAAFRWLAAVKRDRESRR